ncbi:MAG: hypothetical protein HN348_33570, partial [Proteobacteria bacterium]|nr:hypothetical protein [Pseudomonadota bacterium]
MTRRTLISSALALIACPALAGVPSWIPETEQAIRHISHDEVIQTVESSVWDANAQQTVARHGLSLVNVTWEDTGRSKGSSVGPNISDMTIGVRDAHGALHPMPVIRFDNYNDKTADLKTKDLSLLVGNERGKKLRPISIVDMLKNPREYLSNPRSWKGKHSSLWADRDDHVLVSAQACLLPIPQEGEATFTPVIYNYQSSVGNPAVLTMVATREGTSIQVVENSSGYMSEVLYFNQDGERAPFTAMRLSDFQAQGGDSTTSADQATADAGLDMVLVIQVPLKHRAPQRDFWGYGGMMDDMAPGAPTMMMAEGEAMERSVEQ